MVVPDEYTTYFFRSVITFSRATIVTEKTLKHTLIEGIAKKYYPQDSAEHHNTAIDREHKPFCMLKMTVEHLTSKEVSELVRVRETSSQEGAEKQLLKYIFLSF